VIPLHAMQVVAAFEIERLRTGSARAGTVRPRQAKAEGKALGRPSALSASQIAEVGQRLAAGEAVAATARAMCHQSADDHEGQGQPRRLRRPCLESA